MKLETTHLCLPNVVSQHNYHVTTIYYQLMLRTNQAKRGEVGRLALSAAKPDIECETFQHQEPDFPNLLGQPNSY